MKATDLEQQLLQEVTANTLRFWQRQNIDTNENDVAMLLRRNDDMRKAISRGLQNPELWEETVQTLLHLFRYIERLHLNYEWVGWLQKSVDIAPIQDNALFCRLLCRLGQLIGYQNTQQSLHDAVQIHQQALALAEKLADPGLIGLACYQLATDMYRLQRAAEALPLAEKSRQQFTQAEASPQELASVLSLRGLLALDLQEPEQSEAYFVQALTIQQNRGDSLIEQARIYINWGYALSAMAQREEAIEKYRLAEQLLMVTGDLYDLYLCRINLAAIYYWQANYEAATDLFQSIDTNYLRERSHLWLLAMTAHGLGDTALADGRPMEGLPYLNEAVRFWQEQDNKLRLAYSLATRFGVYRKLGWADQAEKDRLESLALISTNPDHIIAAQVRDALKRYQ
ncbi:MAG: hypothetical protein KDE09_10740 [Anaerolineales bacterium]|nr:hypothetical protein [Anaerolineales bacterium]MCB0010766.1 hypothetical protein [Anaerolineales bacterium]MCB0018256.1 hypothetical protein [Anaerolineales bacterium]MCB0030313.1 hypothetical protein [Anaerolineales bacterium]MCB8959184.1 hypothetical protein [Ardenticatenales bacterium]